MRDALQEIKNQRTEIWMTFCLDRSWRAIQKGLVETREYDDDFMEKLAENFRQRLGKEFGNKLYLQPEVTARALKLYSPALVRSLVEIWGETNDEGEA